MRNERCPEKKLPRIINPAPLPHWHGRATLLAGLVELGLWRTAVCLDARPCLRSFAHFVLFLMSRASSNLYSSPQSSQNANFANKT